MNLNFLNDLPEFNNYQPQMIDKNTNATSYVLGEDYLLTVFTNTSPLKIIIDNIDYFDSKGLIPAITSSGSIDNHDFDYYIISKLTKGISLLEASDVDQVELAHALSNHLKAVKQINIEELDLATTKRLMFTDSIETIRTIIASQPCGNDQKVYTDILEQGLNEPDCPSGFVWGNLAPENIIISDGKFAGFRTLPEIQYGDSCFDLSIGYEYFEKESRNEFFNLLGINQSIRKKARNWALSKALISMKDSEKKAMKTLYNIFEEYYG